MFLQHEMNKPKINNIYIKNKYITKEKREVRKKIIVNTIYNIYKNDNILGINLTENTELFYEKKIF